MITPNGGVFGRNPKFNNVTVSGTLTSAGNVTLGTGANLVVASGGDISFAATGDAGNIPASKAFGQLVSTGTNPSAGETVTLGSSTYTFRTGPVSADGDVLIAGTAADTLTNLKNAINNSGGIPGTDYQVAAANASAIAITQSSTLLMLEAITAGVAGNAIALSDTSAQLSRNPFRGGSNAQTNPTTELLNDYEEGTWSPSFAPTTGAFDGVYVRVFDARYIKIGRTVTVWGHISGTFIAGTGSGDLRITGLPYTPSGDSEARFGGISTVNNEWSSTRPTHVQAQPSQTFLNLVARWTSSTSAQTLLTTANASTAISQNVIAFSITYPTS